MHVYYTPRRQHSLLVRITEGVEDGRDTFYSFFDRELIGSTSHLSDTLACFTEDVWIVVLLKLLKFLFVYALGHKFLPRCIVYQFGKVIDSDFFVLILQLSTINQQRHANRDTTQNTDGILSLITHSFILFQFCLFFGSKFFFRLLFQTFFLFILLLSKALIININIARLSHSLSGTNGFLKVIEITQLYIGQLQQLIIIQLTILETTLYHLFYLSLL